MPDRNFDDLAERFESRVHNSLKGKIRRKVIWRDLKENISALNAGTSQTILDMGAGLGHFTIELAKQKHKLVANDVSHAMLSKSQTQATELNLLDNIDWRQSPFQKLTEEFYQHFDIVLCHALLEWLEKPEDLIPVISRLIKPEGQLSLCFYNSAGLTYRNLICGNFRYLDTIDTQTTDNISLTPQNPCSLEQVETWLQDDGYRIEKISGIRVFSDYTPHRRGGNQNPDNVIEMELRYSDKEPYKRLGRYLHIIAKKT